MAKKRISKKKSGPKVLLPGESLELVVARIQQMMDPASVVTHNEKIVDRTGNRRQYDVVVRGTFGGNKMLGVLECKDHGRKKGPDAVEAFAKKAENLGANFRIMVSRKGFTTQALELAKHEHVGCFSLLPNDPKQVGFSFGQMWYGECWSWEDIYLKIHFEESPPPIKYIDVEQVKFNGKPIQNLFVKKLFTDFTTEDRQGQFKFTLRLAMPTKLDFGDTSHNVLSIDCHATRKLRMKRTWARWTGDAFFDWHQNAMIIPANTAIIGGGVLTDLREWDDFDGDVPAIKASESGTSINIILKNYQGWNAEDDKDVPALLEVPIEQTI